MRVLVVYSHPVPESFCASLRDVVVATLKRNGHEVRLIDLYAEGFDPVMHADERRVYNELKADENPMPEQAEHLKWAQAMVFVYPTWWYGLPGMLKGWLDRVLMPGLAFHMPDAEHRLIRPGLTRVTGLAVFTTCGASWWLTAWVGAPGKHQLLRGVRAICAPNCRTAFAAHYLMDSSTPASRARHLARVAATVERLVPGRTSGRLRRLPFLGRRDGPAAGSARLAETGTRRQDGSDQDGGRRVQGSFTIAIDGPAASGKGTISRALAEKFGLAHLDTGLLYRATGAKVADGMAPITAAEGLMPADLERGDLRSAEAGQAASRVAAIPEVRTALVDFQRRFARRQGGAVLDGRDIGTVICPEAEVKLYVVADDETRAKRRFAELAASNPELTLSTVLEDLRARDRRDSERAASPLKPAEDALVLDTTRMSIDEAVEAAAAAVVARMPG